MPPAPMPVLLPVRLTKPAKSPSSVSTPVPGVTVEPSVMLLGMSSVLVLTWIARVGGVDDERAGERVGLRGAVVVEDDARRYRSRISAAGVGVARDGDRLGDVQPADDGGAGAADRERAGARIVVPADVAPSPPAVVMIRRPLLMLVAPV